MLDCEGVIVAPLSDLDSDFVVGEIYDFVSHVFFLVIKLINAGSVKTKEAGGEENCVLEVSLDLSLNCVSDDAFLRLKSDANTAKNNCQKRSQNHETYGVCRLDPSLRTTSIPLRLTTPITAL